MTLSSTSHAPKRTPKGSHLIDGTSIARQVRGEIAHRVKHLKTRGIQPKLGVILVGGHAPSQIYVKYKRHAAEEVGIQVIIHHFDQTVTLERLYQCVDQMNEDPETHGILVQLPLPNHLSSTETWSVVERVRPDKDVDGLHPLNLGLIGNSTSLDQPLSAGLIACTPLGCLRLLNETLGSIQGKRALVIGRSRIVGRPMAALLTAADATVTIAHSRTHALRDHLRTAEIIVAAAGVPLLIQDEDLREDAVLIDVGIHRQGDGRLCGDIDFDRVDGRVAAISPVPGGVGPMTIASLMSNVCLAATRQQRGSL